MVALRDRPFFTDIFYSLNKFSPAENSAYILGTSPEERSIHFQKWEAKTKNVTFIKIVEQHSAEISISINGTTENLSLRSGKQLRELWNKLNAKSIYLDITGLAHHVWAPLLREALNTCSQVSAVYVEPGDYKFSATPKEGEIFDLSERIKGISPIPGFVSLKEPSEDEVCFVPLLGFEGTRLAYLVEQVQPPGDKIFPIIGVPGFRLEYPFYAYHGNQLPLMQTHAWKNVRFAIANCPFSLFYKLGDIAESHPNNYLKISPIGTKPHALGAVLYTIVNHKRVELIYDHPIRKATRTKGFARLLVYHLSAFISSCILS